MITQDEIEIMLYKNLGVSHLNLQITGIESAAKEILQKINSPKQATNEDNGNFPVNIKFPYSIPL